ncbi:MAG: tRNA 5-methoxyuridine(34)/uridine 5-oxyacetic acid(34) synthase CmoB [Elusimicrobiota bacterium]|jgi:tRNA (mo5U34)-methyltransferase|nr:tRNA 5-methoxyuridine(34)/uridine 5-oxyacetic acid(34) synthase CmoB [Elusimicrobiota bacterium]
MFKELLYKETFSILKSSKLKNHIEYLQNEIERNIYKENFEQYVYWDKIYNCLPNINLKKSDIDFINSDSIKIGYKSQLQNIKGFKNLLKKFIPWRKGPFEIFGILIDTEWKSNLKWDRIRNKISPLKNKIVLDVGAGNGYYSFKMRGQGAKIVIGVDPYPVFISQFLLFQKYIKDNFVINLPLKVECLTNDMKFFDTVFSMGILYHRISPIDHLMKLYSFLKKDGELVLETLISTSKIKDLIFPIDTYSKMPNVWFIPSIEMLTIWLKRVGFRNIRCIDISLTTRDEQRKTKWMTFESLDNFLDKNDKTKTCEGYQAPIRAVFIANK